MLSVRRSVFSAAMMMLASCSSTGPVMSFQDQGLSWPEGTDSQRIVFIGEFSRETDLGIKQSIWARFVSLAAGSSDNTMIRPMAAVATPGAGIIFVADPDARCVHRYDLNRARYRCLATKDDEPLVSPIGMTILDDGSVLVSDSQLGRIFRATPDARVLEAFETSVVLDQPTGLFWDERSARLFVTDTGRHSVLVLDKHGNHMQTIGERGSAPGALNFPTYLWKDLNGDLIVTDSLNFRVQRFGTDGKFSYSFGENGDRPGDFSRPKGIATDSMGNVYVIDALMHSMQIFSPEGQLLLAIGGQGRGRGQFWLPNGIFVTSDNMIFVADSYNKRVQVFRYKGPGS